MDVDVDTPPSFDSTKVFPSWIRAAVVRDGKMTPHPCGVYPQTIPRDPMSGLSAIPYDAAEELGYLKIDFLHLHQYSAFKTRAEIDELLEQEPNWTLLQLQSTHSKLFQLSKHGDLLDTVKPKNIEELADCMALIRPGKKQFQGLYLKDRQAARRILYAKDDSGYSFKKSHALAYSFVVWLQLHLIEQGKL
jgi:DNA polymerase III alpha subunit